MNRRFVGWTAAVAAVIVAPIHLVIPTWDVYAFAFSRPQLYQVDYVSGPYEVLAEALNRATYFPADHSLDLLIEFAVPYILWVVLLGAGLALLATRKRLRRPETPVQA